MVAVQLERGSSLGCEGRQKELGHQDRGMSVRMVLVLALLPVHTLVQVLSVLLLQALLLSSWRDLGLARLGKRAGRLRNTSHSTHPNIPLRSAKYYFTTVAAGGGRARQGQNFDPWVPGKGLARPGRAYHLLSTDRRFRSELARSGIKPSSNFLMAAFHNRGATVMNRWV